MPLLAFCLVRGICGQSGAFRTEPEGQQQAKTMPDNRAALSLSVASFLSGTSLPLPD
jgi:hypothetical protein